MRDNRNTWDQDVMGSRVRLRGYNLIVWGSAVRHSHSI